MFAVNFMSLAIRFVRQIEFSSKWIAIGKIVYLELNCYRHEASKTRHYSSKWLSIRDASRAAFNTPENAFNYRKRHWNLFSRQHDRLKIEHYSEVVICKLKVCNYIWRQCSRHWSAREYNRYFQLSRNFASLMRIVNGGASNLMHF